MFTCVCASMVKCWKKKKIFVNKLFGVDCFESFYCWNLSVFLGFPIDAWYKVIKVKIGAKKFLENESKIFNFLQNQFEFLFHLGILIIYLYDFFIVWKNR